MALEQYRRKRDFGKTPEPRGKKARVSTARARVFVVQKHESRQLHYDIRLERNGVLVSWALPKGPSLDPAEKRLAVHVEDHPIEYAGFEGVIPEGEYGGGTVMIWDRGTWSPLTDEQAGFDAGNLKVELKGTKLRGGWAFVRMKRKDRDEGDNWLLIKERDEYARSEKDVGIVDQEPFSAVSGRGLREIADDADAVWTGNGLKGRVPHGFSGRRRPAYATQEFSAKSVRNAKQLRTLPRVEAVTVKAASAVPETDDWLHEIEQEGRRLIVTLDSGRVMMGHAAEDWTARLPEIARHLALLPVSQAVLDGVAVAVDKRGVADMQAFEFALANGKTGALRFCAVDLPVCDGWDLRQSPLLERKRMLQQLIAAHPFPTERLYFSDHVVGHGASVLKHAQKLGAAGIVSKKLDSTYAPGKAPAWVSTSCRLAGTATSKRKPGPILIQQAVEVAGVRLTHPDRILYPEAGVTKRMLAQYYDRIADQMLPHVAARPLSLYRCPGGLEREGFFQKQLHDMPSEHLQDATVVEKGREDSYVVLNDVRGLVTLAQWSVLEIHVWGCKAKDLDHPDRLVFDLDPAPGVPWEQIVEGAKGVRFLLEREGLECFLKSTGGKGLHVVVPILPSSTWSELKRFASQVARSIADADARHYTARAAKDERVGKVYIDYLRNVRGATSVAPFSPRARRGAPLAVPVDWRDLDRARSPQWLTRHAGIAGQADPWHALLHVRQSIPKRA